MDPHVLLAAPGLLDEHTARLDTAVGGDRVAAAVVLTGPAGDSGEPTARITVTEHGALLTAMLPVAGMTAFALPAADADDIAQAITLERDGAVDEPTPRSTGVEPWDSFIDAAGALRPEYTVPRSEALDPQTAASSSVLPAPDEEYLDTAATSTDDLAALAPVVTTRTRAAVERADPELDDLLAAWHDPNTKLAKLQILGPVTLTAHGRPPTKQPDYCVEAVVYLWNKPHGASTNEFANDLWPDHDYRGTDSFPKDTASRTRIWLGTDPRTGTEYLPRATRGGTAAYRIDGLLVDYDLFRRLRARGEARGADGLPDLIAALNLVTGTPLSQRRACGYTWLPAGEELLYTGAIIEVAHLVATRALDEGDTTTAIHACQTALQLDTNDDRALLSLAKAHENAGRPAETRATILRLTRLDEPPARTLEVMRRNGRLARNT